MSNLNFDKFTELCLRARTFAELKGHVTFTELKEHLGTNVANTYKVIKRLLDEGYFKSAPPKNGENEAYWHKNSNPYFESG